jgi:hypothetical protein
MGSVIGNIAVPLELANGRRDRRCRDINQRRRKRGDAHEPAALSVGRVGGVFGDLLAVRRHFSRMVVAIGVDNMMGRSMFVNMTVGVDVACRRIAVHAHHAGHMAIVRQAWSDGMFAGQCV